MLADTKLRKLEEELNKVQARTSTRNLTLAEIVSTIGCAEEVVSGVPAEFRTMLHLYYSPHRVAKSYNYVAEGTVLQASFNKAGKCISATVMRKGIGVDPKERLVVNNGLAVGYIEEMVGSEAFTLLNYVQKSNILTLVYKAIGANQHGFINL